MTRALLPDPAGVYPGFPKHIVLLLTVSLSLLSGFSGSSEAGPVTATNNVLLKLEQKMSEVKTVQASFVQEKQLAILSQKVVLRGKMALENPGRLAWHVDKPVRYAMVISDGVMRQWDEDTKKVQKTSMTGNPVWKIVSEQIQGWFSGKYSALAREYDVEIVEGKSATCLNFKPKKDAAAEKAIKSVTVTFQKDERYVQEIRIADTSGDVTTLNFLDVILDAPVPPGSWEVEPRD